MALSHAERGRLGAIKANAARTPEQHRETMRRARLASAVKAVVDRAPELNADQIERLRTALSVGGATDDR